MAMGRSAAFAVAVFFAWAGSAAGASPDTDAIGIEAISEQIVVAPNGSYVSTIHSEIKAVNEAGALQASRMSVLFDSEMQTLDIVEAHTLKKDGTKIPVDIKTIYEQLPADNSLAVTSFRVKVLLFPQFSAGDTAVYTVRQTTPKPMFDGAFLYNKYFPRVLGYKNAEVTITAPKTLPLKIENHDVTFRKEEVGDNIIYRWQRSAPADKLAKTALISPLDREPRLIVSSFKDYSELGRAYAAQSEPKAAVTDKIRTLADTITATAPNRRDQARLIYEWVVLHIRYLAVEIGAGSYIPHDAETVLARGYGDCKDHEVLLRALLKAKGIEAQGVLINGTDAYTLTDVPSFTQLNHIISYLPEFGLYLDASVPTAQFGTLPLTEYGKPAVLAALKGAGPVTLPMPKPGSATVHQKTVQKITADGTLSGTTITTATGPYAVTLRFLGYAVQGVGPEKAGELQMAARGFKNGTGKIVPDSMTELGESYTIRGEFSAKGWESVLKGDATTMPGGLRLMAVTGDSAMGPLYGDDDSANEPTNCVSAKTSEDITLEFPSGYTTRFLPKDETVTTPNLSFTVHWTEAANSISVHREFISKIDQPVCRGTIRKQTAEALKQIAKKFDQTFEIIHSVQSYKDAPAIKSDSAEALIGRGEAFEKAEDYTKAIADFTAALAIEPNNTTALFDRGYSYDMIHDREHAIADYTSLITANDNSAAARSNRGLAYAEQNKLDLALADFDRAVTLDPDTIDYRLQRAEILFSTAKYDRAIPDLDAIIAAQSNNARAYAGRCAAYEVLKKYETALPDCNKAITLTPNASYLYLLRSSIRHALGDHYGGNRDSAKAAQIDPKLEQPGGPWQTSPKKKDDSTSTQNLSPMARSTMEGGRALDLGDYDTAASAFERAIKQGMPDAMVLPSLCFALSHSKRVDEAAYQCSRALQTRENNSALLHARGLAYYRQGKYREAQEDFETLLRLDPKDPFSLYQRGLTRKKLGDSRGDADIAKATAQAPNVARQIPKEMRP